MSTIGSIESPQYPNQYANNSDCFYQIQPVGAKRITLKFTDFEIEPDYNCSYDYVEVSQPNNLLRAHN